VSILPPDKLVPVASLEAYLFNPTGRDWGKLLMPFSPPLPRKGQVQLASFFADVFVEDEHGAVWWVNGLEERVDRIAINLDKAIERISREHLVMLKTKLLEQLIKGDRLLPAGMLYGLKTPRSQGGKYHPDNIGTATIADTFAYLGQLFREKQAPPPAGPAARPDPKQKSKPSNSKPSNSKLWGKKK
jgi:hypothetical protein